MKLPGLGPSASGKGSVNEDLQEPDHLTCPLMNLHSAIPVLTMMNFHRRAEQEAGTFQHGNGQEVRRAIAECQEIVVGLEPVIASIGERRNEWLAYLDPNTIADPNALVARAKLTLPDLDRGFKETAEITLRMSSLYEGTIGDLKYIGGDDYEVALDWIRPAKCAFIEKYEHEFKQKGDGPRPKDCSRRDWELL